MQKLLAEILEVKEQNPRPSGKTEFSEYLLKVKVKGPACKGFVLPPRVKGRVWSTVRRYSSLWQPSPGDVIILTAPEVRSLLQPLRIEPPILTPESGSVRFRLFLHNPSRKKLEYKILFPLSRTVRSGILTESEEVTLPLPEQTLEGYHQVRAVCGRWKAEATLSIVKPGSVHSYTTDVNGDGLDESIIENEFVRLSLAPHLGGRMESLWLTSSDSDFFGRTLEYDKDEYVEYGGSDEHLGDFPGDLWKAKFKEERSDSSVALSYTWKGMHLTKRVELLKSLPVVSQILTIRWNGKGEKDVLPWHRMAMKLDTPPWASVVHLHTNEKLEKIRHIPATGVWRNERDYYGLRFGTLFCSHETRGGVFTFMTDRDCLENVLCTSVKGLQLISPYFKRTMLESKAALQLRYLYILGDDFCLTSRDCFVAGASSRRNGRRSVAVIGKTLRRVDKIEGRLSSGESLTLRPKKVVGVGRVFFGHARIRSNEAVEVRLTIGSKRYTLKIRGAQ